jgi:hypothetical protein
MLRNFHSALTVSDAPDLYRAAPGGSPKVVTAMLAAVEAFRDAMDMRRAAYARQRFIDE